MFPEILKAVDDQETAAAGIAEVLVFEDPSVGVGDEDGVEAGVEGREAEIVTVLEFFPIEVEDFGGFFTRGAAPAIGEDDTADIPKQGGDCGCGQKRCSGER